MMTFIWILVVIALSTFVVETAFVYVSTAKRLLESDLPFPMDMKAIAYFWLVVGLPADMIFNLTRGTFMFRELPRELLFTARIKRHQFTTGWRGKKAKQWAKLLNFVDPGHVRTKKK